jgi:hypothetical protein
VCVCLSLRQAMYVFEAPQLESDSYLEVRSSTHTPPRAFDATQAWCCAPRVQPSRFPRPINATPDGSSLQQSTAPQAVGEGVVTHSPSFTLSARPRPRRLYGPSVYV